MGGWRVDVLGSVAAADGFAIGPFGSRMKADNYVSDGVRVVRGQNITGRGSIEGDFVYVSESFAESLGSARLRQGDIVLPHRGAIGRAALVTDDDLVMSTSLMRLRVDRDRADPYFVAAFLSSSEGEREILKFASTVGTPGIGQPLTSLRQVRIPLPPIAEQRRIATVLRRLDELVDTNRKQVQRLRAIALAVYLSMASNEALFGDVAELVRDGVGVGGLTAGTPYVGLEHLATDGGGLTSVGDAGAVVSQKSRFAAGDVLYGKLRPYFRKYDRPGFAGVCSTDIWVLRGKRPYGTPSVSAIVAMPEFSDLANQGNKGTRMPRADWTHVSTLRVPVASPGVLVQIEAVLDDYWQGIVGLNEEAVELSRSRDELLRLLMSGQVRVKDLA